MCMLRFFFIFYDALEPLKHFSIFISSSWINCLLYLIKWLLPPDNRSLWFQPFVFRCHGPSVLSIPTPPMQLLFSGAARRSLHRLAHSVLLILSPPPSFSPSLHFAPSTSCSSTEHAQYGFLSRCSGAAADAGRFYGENGVIEPMMTTLAWLGRKGRGDSFHSSEYVKKTNIAGCWF